MPIIYHVTTIADWKDAQLKGYYDHPSLTAEGFILFPYTTLFRSYSLFTGPPGGGRAGEIFCRTDRIDKAGDRY